MHKKFILKHNIYFSNAQSIFTQHKILHTHTNRIHFISKFLRRPHKTTTTENTHPHILYTHNNQLIHTPGKKINKNLHKHKFDNISNYRRHNDSSQTPKDNAPTDK